MVVCYFLVGQAPDHRALLALAGLAIACVALLGVGFSMGLAGARYRDLHHAIGAITTLAFVLTPVFWDKNLLKPGSLWLALNPFYYLLEVIRGPLLGQIPSTRVWVIAILIALFSLTLGVFTYLRNYKRLAFWI
jgi:ABC-type polysaccharide/polyol phosphate export permease